MSVEVMRPTLEEFKAAAKRLHPTIIRTPIVPLHSYGKPSNIMLKLETLQPVTSFKVRGVYNAVACLSDAQRKKGLSTCSAGNTAQALCWTAQKFGVPARSLMPTVAPVSKVEAVKSYGGTPVLVPRDDVFKFMTERHWERPGYEYTYIHPWTNRDVLIGHGTMGLEIMEQMPNVDTVFIPVGGGGLLGGVGSALKALKPDVKIVGVEPAGCPSLWKSIQEGKPTSVECNTICDGVAVPFITPEMFPLLSNLVERVDIVEEETVKETIRLLSMGNKLVVEPSGALATAAALAAGPAAGNCLAIVTGGSIDPAQFAGYVNSPRL
eukprot:TRINITY_DN93853_c0_g1_i1.p1 TRINITY_DN93853_c0_g1~~TRINITY_DN93853_c0_g1_i1.p1  ORF type:complete len:323 (-),score=39.71 TRINITY_DN93853_c0_g1_i1:24-992(-)